MKLSFKQCSADGCNITSATGEYDSMMLRIGFSKCCKHLDCNDTEVVSRIYPGPRHLDVEMITVIFYNIGLSKDGQVEHLSAFSTTGDNFSSIIKTTPRANTSIILRNFSSDVYNALSLEPSDAMERFMNWINMTHSTNTGNTDPKNIVLTAHFGSCHDHIYLLRTMIGYGIGPLDFRLADSLALFKTIKGPAEHSAIALLVAKYAGWLPYMPDGADSNARALRAVVMAAFQEVRSACYAFSISCERFRERTGLNALEFGHLKYIHHSPIHNRAIICRESGKIIGYEAHQPQR
ncbi:hypothetical protein BDV33DRAFT_186321 [Aspergillus novoparasiticus]|uniref:Uncharacterized protein n=1 Tax=Aspergillus novoparasiticus TaxID=986946 RepID=A0A5N6E5P2_9EURO|nr:hypothetical protein BDV33DRAFT_186321 [Aspergillus novoparasiticus]